MFSVIPMPHIDWKETNMRFILAAFPVVGIAVGVLSALWCMLSGFFSFPPMILALGLTLIPLAVSGGIHMDGYCDTVDAISSHADMEKKRAILKDPHTGAFGVIGVCAYLLFYYVICCQLKADADAVRLLFLVYIVARCASGFASVTLKPAGDTGLQKTMHDAAYRGAASAILIAMFAVCILLAALTGLVFAYYMIVCTAVVFLITAGIAKKSFGGMSGDIAGFQYQITELTMITALVIIQNI